MCTINVNVVRGRSYDNFQHKNLSYESFLTQNIFVPMLSVIQVGSTGLMEASINGHTSTMRILLEAKTDPNFTDEVKLHYSHCLYNSTVAQKGHVHYQFQYFQLPVLKSTSNMGISHYQF